MELCAERKFILFMVILNHFLGANSKMASNAQSVLFLCLYFDVQLDKKMFLLVVFPKWPISLAVQSRLNSRLNFPYNFPFQKKQQCMMETFS